METEKTLRFGIMCDNPLLYPWQIQCLKALANSNKAELVLVITDGSGIPPTKTKGWPQLLFRLYRRFFLQNPETRKIDASSLLQEVPHISCVVERPKKFSQYFSSTDIEQIRTYNLDFILRFGFGIIRGEILQTPKYGVWSFHNADEQKYRGGPSIFWEIYNNEPVRGAIMQKLTDRLDGGIILRKGFFRLHNYKYLLNQKEAYREFPRWVTQACTDIINGHTDYFFAPPSTSQAPIYHPPTNLFVIIFFFKLINNKIRERIRRTFFREQWNIGLCTEPIQSFLTEKNQLIYWLEEKPNFYRADPFAFIHQNKINILHEKFLPKKNIGVISSISPNPQDTQEEIAISDKVNLSYPFIFEDQGEKFCLVCAPKNHRISLYKLCKNDGWKKQGDLLDNFQGVDPTIIRHNNMWWLFCGHSHDNPNQNLHLFFSPTLSDPFQPHAQNPVKTDVRSARGAGTPFIHQNNLYRPAQDCSITYGGRVAINKIVSLNTAKFQEHTVKWVNPPNPTKYPDGFHTLSSVGQNTVIDSKKHVFTFKKMLRLAKKKPTIQPTTVTPTPKPSLSSHNLPTNNEGQVFVDLGCGTKPHPKASITIDSAIESQASIIADISQKIPLPDSSVDYIYSRTTLEHLTHEQNHAVFQEVERILKPGGVFWFRVPHFFSAVAGDDPTHHSFWTLKTPEYFTGHRLTHVFKNSKLDVVYKRVSVEIPTPLTFFFWRRFCFKIRGHAILEELIKLPYIYGFVEVKINKQND